MIDSDRTPSRSCVSTPSLKARVPNRNTRTGGYSIRGGSLSRETARYTSCGTWVVKP